MSLISTKNIITPLTNKVHLTTIILVVLSFAFLRVAGGSVEAVHENERFKNKQETQADSKLSIPSKPAGKNPAGKIRDESKFPWNKQKTTKKETPQDKQHKTLDDIERLLN